LQEKKTKLKTQGEKNPFTQFTRSFGLFLYFILWKKKDKNK